MLLALLLTFARPYVDPISGLSRILEPPRESSCGSYSWHAVNGDNYSDKGHPNKPWATTTTTTSTFTAFGFSIVFITPRVVDPSHPGGLLFHLSLCCQSPYPSFPPYVVEKIPPGVIANAATTLSPFFTCRRHVTPLSFYLRFLFFPAPAVKQQHPNNSTDPGQPMMIQGSTRDLIVRISIISSFFD